MDYEAKINKRMLIINDENKAEFRFQYSAGANVNLNETGKFIMSKCFKGLKVNEIVDALIKECSLSLDKRDMVFKDVINILTKFWELGAIKWVGETPYGDKYREAIYNYELIELTIQEDIDIFKDFDGYKWNAYTNIELEKNINIITMQLLTNTTKYYCIKNSKDDSTLKISIQIDDFSKQVTLKGVKVDPDFTYDDISFHTILSWIIKREIFDKKSSLSFLESIPVVAFASNDMLKSILEKADFRKVGTLKHEVKYTDIEVYIDYIKSNE